MSTAGRVTFGLVGAFGVVRDGRPLAAAELGSRKARLLLKLLVVERGTQVPTDRIVELLWGDRPPQQPADNVATLVSRLRAVLGPEAIVGTRSGYRLGPALTGAVDVDEAARLVEQAQSRLAGGEPAVAMAAAHRALDLLGAGSVLDDEPYAEWAGQARLETADLLARARHAAAAAALAAGDPRAARQAAELAVAADPLDEPAYRALIRAHQLAGEPARALAAYERLRTVLATELGVDPAPASRELHLAILRDQEPAAQRPAAQHPTASEAADGGDALVGREAESARLAAQWSAAVAGQPAVLLVTGEAGIGKTRLAEELVRLARSTGGAVLQARCYHTERSLFLQPLVDAVRETVTTLPPATLREVAGAWAAPLADLIPEVGAVLGGVPREETTPENQRRRAFEAVTAVLRALSERRPVLLVLDDLQNAGLATVEFLHYLARHLGGSRMLAVATVRAEEGDVLPRLGDVAEQLRLGPLTPDAVARLTKAADRPDLADRIYRSTRGHTLFVVETLRGLIAGDEGIPGSLQAAVLGRVNQAGPQAEEALRAAAVLGPPFEPAVLAATLGIPALDAARRCEHALQSYLLVVAGGTYEFANDLVQEVLYATTPAPTRVEYHRRAAELLTDRPEAVAAHAAAAGEWLHAARAWLHAGESALLRHAASDAEQMLDRALEAAARAGNIEVEARAHLIRGRAREVLSEYDAAWADHQAAAAQARAAGDRRLEMLALLELGGDVPVARRRQVAECEPYLEAGVKIARSLGDRGVEAQLLARLAIVASNQLRFDRAVDHGRLAVAAGRAARDDHALAAALDGLKNAYAYLGDIAGLEPVLDELEPLLRRLGDLWRLQWTVFESAFPALARADWNAVAERIDEALAVNRRSGYAANQACFLAHRGWIERLRGRYDDALAYGRRALDATAKGEHPWWGTVTRAYLGVTLLETGERAGALALLEEARAAAMAGGAEAYLVRWLAVLAEASGRRDAVEQADRLLRGVSAPAGAAWLLGSDSYLAVARAWLNQGEPDRASAVVAPLLTAAERHGWVALLADGSLVAGRCAAAAGDPDRARNLLTRSRELAEKHGMAGTAEAAAAQLKSLTRG